MIFSEKVIELTDTYNLTQLAEEAKLESVLLNWRDGRADRRGPRTWGPVVRLANACGLDADQTTELLELAGKPPFDELQFRQPDDYRKEDAVATRKAIEEIQRRSKRGFSSLFQAFQHGAINEGYIIPRDHLSDEQMIPVVQEAEKRNLRLELRLFYVVTSAVAVLLLVLVVTLIASPTARETAERMVSPIVETVRQFFKGRFESPPQIVPTQTPSPTSTSSVSPSATFTPTITPVSTLTPNSAEEDGSRATDIAIAVNQTLVAVTQTALIDATSTISSAELSGNPATTAGPQTPTPASEYPCEAEVISPRGIWPLSISFRNVPNGTSSVTEEFQLGDRAIIRSVSADSQWYEIAELNGRVLGWASPEFFNDCIQTSQ